MAITKTKQIFMTVLAEEGDFNIICTDSLQVKAGSNVGFTIDVEPLLGFNKTVAFSLGGLPAGSVVTWNTKGNIWQPGQGNLQCDIAVPLNNSLVGNYTLTLTGVSA
jgi:hypothetical protein